MSLTHHTVSLTPTELEAAHRVNAVMALAPRLKISGWRLAVARASIKPVSVDNTNH